MNADQNKWDSGVIYLKNFLFRIELVPQSHLNIGMKYYLFYLRTDVD